MGKNFALALLALTLGGFALWAISSGVSRSTRVLPTGSEEVTESIESGRPELSLPDPGEAVILPVDTLAEEARQEVRATVPVQGLVDLDLVLMNPQGEPIPGAKLRVHLAGGKVLTRWTSQLGDFTLFDVPVGEFSVSAPGYRIAFPNVDDPTMVTESGELQIQVAGTHEALISIYSDSIDEGEIRLYRKVHVERVTSNQDVQVQAQNELAKELLYNRLKGPTPSAGLGIQPFERRTFYGAPQGNLIASLTECRFPGKFKFSGLNPGSYQIVVPSRHHTKRALSFEISEPLTPVSLDISDGYEVIVTAQFRSGKLPAQAMIRLLDQFGTDVPRRTKESSKDSATGRWTFSDLEAGTWFVEARPGPRTIGRQYAVEVPTHTPNVPVLELLLEESRETTLRIQFQTSQAITIDDEDLLVAVFRGPAGQYLGARRVSSAGLRPAASGEIIELDVGPLFPGEYDVFLFPDPGADSLRFVQSEDQSIQILAEYSVDWVGPFEAKKLPISIAVGSDPATVEVALDWYRSPSDQATKAGRPFPWGE